MPPKYHFILSFFAAFIMLFFGVNFLFCLLFFLSSFFIDFDHYLHYIFKKKSFNLSNAYHYHKNYLAKELERRNQKSILMVFHTIEFMFLILILSTFLKIIWPIFLGCLFHIVIDIIHELTMKHKKYKRVYSLIFYAIKTKRIS